MHTPVPRLQSQLVMQAGVDQNSVMPKRLKKFLFGGTPALQQKQIRQFWLTMGFAVLLCGVIGVVLYLLNKQGRF